MPLNFTIDRQKDFLRAAILFAMLLGLEAKNFYRAFFGSFHLRFPIFDLEFAHSLLNYRIVFVVYIGFTLLACYRRWLVPAGILGALACFLTINLNLDHRLQFHYLPAFSLLAFAASEVLGRSPAWKVRSDIPITLLLGSIYGFAAFHKLVNFHLMQLDLPYQVLRQANGVLGPLCSDVSCALLAVTSWIVVPIEFSLMILCLSRRWVRERLVLAVLFHWTVAVLATISVVSLSMLALQFYLAFLQQPVTSQKLLSNRRWKVWLAVGVLLAAGYLGLHLILGSSWGPLVKKACRVSLEVLPLAFLLWPFICEKIERSSPIMPFSAVWRAMAFPKETADFALGVFLIVLLLFGFSPLLLTDGYATSTLGWDMFSGGYRRTATYELNVPAKHCFYVRQSNLLIEGEAGDHLTFQAKHAAYLQDLLWFFGEKRHCIDRNQLNPAGVARGYFQVVRDPTVDWFVLPAGE